MSVAEPVEDVDSVVEAVAALAALGEALVDLGGGRMPVASQFDDHPFGGDPLPAG